MAFCSSFAPATKWTSLSIHRRTVVPIPALSLTHAPQRSVSRKLRIDRCVRRAEESGSSTPDIDAIVKDLSEKWDTVENKSSIAIYGVGAIAVLYITTSIVAAVNSIPLLPKFLELVGFVYTSWFVYRYLLFKSSREELAKDVEELKSKIAGKQDSSPAP